MGNTTNEINKTSEERIYGRFFETSAKIKSKTSLFYYMSLILLNFLSLVLTMFFLNREENIEKLDLVFENMNSWTIVLYIGIFILIMLLIIFPTYLSHYARTKQRKFFAISRMSVLGEFYGRTTMFGSGNNVMSATCLARCGVEQKNAIDTALGKNIFKQFATVLYSFVILCLGVVFWNKNTNILLIIVAFLVFACYCANIVLILIFNCDSRKKSVMLFLARFYRRLNKLKFIKDYEYSYNKKIDELITYNKIFRQNKLIIFVNIVSNVLVYLLKASILYLILISMNVATYEIVGELIFKVLILELIIQMWPLKWGTLIYEILFIILFNSIFFKGYIFWALLIYRVLDYFVYIVQWLIFLIIDLVYGKIKRI